jgi:hypothetical protein
MTTRNCAPSTSSPSTGTMSESCANNRTFSAPVYLKHKISFSVDSLLSTCTSTNKLNGSKFSSSTNSSPKDISANRTPQTRNFVESETEHSILNTKPLLRSDQSTLTQPPSPVVDSCNPQVQTHSVDVSIDGAATRQYERECNEDLEDEELEVDDEESDVGRTKLLYDSQLQYFDTRINDDSSGTRASPSPSIVRDAEDASPPVVPKPLHHPGLALGPAGTAGPPCWSFPSQFAWMPVYRSVSPSSE